MGLMHDSKNVWPTGCCFESGYVYIYMSVCILCPRYMKNRRLGQEFLKGKILIRQGGKQVVRRPKEGS